MVLMPRYLRSAQGARLAVCALLVAAPQGAMAARAASGAGRGPTKMQAVVTYVAGSVTVLHGAKTKQRVSVGDQLAPGARLTLGRSSQLTVVWSTGGTSSLRGPREELKLARPAAAQKSGSV